MIDTIILGEFDINQGNIIKLEYPIKLDIPEIVLSSYVIPEGSHNIKLDNYSFILKNKKFNKNKQNLDIIKLTNTKFIDLKEKEYKKYRLTKVVKYNEKKQEWEDMYPNSTSKVFTLKINYAKHNNYSYYYFSIYEGSNSNPDKENFLSTIHKDIQFKKLEKTFASLYDLDHVCYGVNFDSINDLNEIETIINKNSNKIISEKESNTSEETFYEIESSIRRKNDLFCFCYLNTIEDKSLERGALMKSITLCTSQLINLNTLKPVAQILLEEIFKISLSKKKTEDKDKEILQLIQEAFVNVNKIPNKYLIASSIKKTLLSNIFANNMLFLSINPENVQFGDSLAEKTYKFTLAGKSSVIDLPQFSLNERIYNSSLIQFVELFKEQTMTIFEAIVTDKKIMFTSEHPVSCDQLCFYMFNVVALTGGQYGVLDKIYGLRNLYEMDFLETKGAIYFVTNPIFKAKKDAWDIMCEVDTGKVVVSDAFQKELNSYNKESNDMFIKEIMYKIKRKKNENLDNYKLESYFKHYTNYLLDIFSDSIAIDDEEIVADINKHWQRKLKFKQSKMFKDKTTTESFYEVVVSNGISYNQICHLTKNLLYRRYIDKAELKLIYSSILKFIENNDFAVAMFLYLLLEHSNSYKVFLAVFSKIEETAKMCKDIINVIKTSKYKHIGELIYNYAFDFN